MTEPTQLTHGTTTAPPDPDASHSRVDAAGGRRRGINPGIKRVLQVAVSVLLVGAIIWYVRGQFADIAEVRAVIGDLGAAGLSLLVLAAAWNLVTYWAVAVVATPGLRMSQAAVLTQSTTAVANAVPAGGAVAVGLTYTMLSSWGFSKSRSTLFVVVTGIWNNFFKLGMPVLALAILALQGTPGAGRSAAAVAGLAALVAAVVVFTLVLRSEQFAARTGVVTGRWMSALLRLVRRGPVHGWDLAVTKWRGRVIGLVRRRGLALTASALLSHVSLYVVLLVALRTIGVSEPQVGWAEVLAVFAFARLVTAIPITPGGVGVVELALIAGLTQAGGAAAPVVAAVLLYRLLTYVLPILTGVGTYVYWRRNRSWRDSAPPMDATARPAGPSLWRSWARANRPANLLVYAAAGGLVVAATSVIASSGRVARPEQLVFNAINSLPEFLHWPMWTFQLVGLLGLPIAVAAIALWRRRIRLAVALVAFVPLKLFVEKGILKELIHRQRPGVTEPDAILRDVPSAGDSFPSGHAMIAFGIAALLTPYLGRRGRLVVWSLAGLNGLARVYLGAHNPLDVVCGAAAGLLLGGVLTWIVGIGPVRASRTRP
jgi:putative heme transporter